MAVKFSLIICTYMRPESLLNLLHSVKEQSLYPNEILVIDGSSNDKTNTVLSQSSFENLKYFKVDNQNRGLTKQRNFGLTKVDSSVEIICFLDDDIVLTKSYFKELIKTYEIYPEALAVGGYILNEATWWQGNKVQNLTDIFCYDGWCRKEPLRYRIRKWFGLLPDSPPGILPTFSHGRSIGFLPPSGKTYQIEQIMGGVSSYRKEIFDKIQFSDYFVGYGLYEDADFSIRLAKLGKLFVNTNAQLFHIHDDSGRPNKYKYGKMVLKNGWYVWRVKYPNPSIKARLKWNMTALLLALIRVSNIFNTKERKEAFTESLGRFMGWFSLLFNKPKLEK